VRSDIEYVRSLEARLEELRAAADKADAEYRAEIARLSLTDEEREAVAVAAEAYADDHGERFAATLRALLERLG
jgi:hypothetical protein